MSDLKVALEAMRADAAMWSADRGLNRTYENGRVVLEDLLCQAMTAFNGLGDSLRSAADTYEREEDANLHDMNRLTGKLK